MGIARRSQSSGSTNTSESPTKVGFSVSSRRRQARLGKDGGNGKTVSGSERLSLSLELPHPRDGCGPGVWGQRDAANYKNGKRAYTAWGLDRMFSIPVTTGIKKKPRTGEERGFD